MKTIPFKGQDYESLRKNFNSKKLFTDPIFKANLDSLAFSKDYQTQLGYYNIQWKRPNVINSFL